MCIIYTEFSKLGVLRKSSMILISDTKLNRKLLPTYSYPRQAVALTKMLFGVDFKGLIKVKQALS